MSSISIPVDDRTTKARIRDAAISTFAELGVSATTARKVAARARVSPGSVIHHFGSMDGLRAHCDQYLVATIRELKTSAMAGAGFDPLVAVRAASEGPPLAKYLARTLVDGSESVSELVDEIVADAVQYTRTGVESGMLQPTRFPEERAAVLTMWSLGALVLHEHLARHIGIDITEVFDDPSHAEPYAGPAMELLRGLFTEKALALFGQAFSPESDREGTE